MSCLGPWGQEGVKACHAWGLQGAVPHHPHPSSIRKTALAVGGCYPHCPPPALTPAPLPSSPPPRHLPSPLWPRCPIPSPPPSLPPYQPPSPDDPVPALHHLQEGHGHGGTQAGGPECALQHHQRHLLQHHGVLPALRGLRAAGAQGRTQHKNMGRLSQLLPPLTEWRLKSCPKAEVKVRERNKQHPSEQQGRTQQRDKGSSARYLSH